MNLRVAIALSSLAGLAGAGCAPELDRSSELETYRILAVQKDKPYAQPGETIHFTMLDYDGSRRRDPDIQRVWLAGCENPAADLYQGCFQTLGDIERLTVGRGTGFSAMVSADIISSRPPPPDPNQPEYGLAYVFFAACTGTFDDLEEAISSDGFPLICRDEDGRRLGADDFVIGYTSVFVYEDREGDANDIRNENPRVTGITVAGETLDSICIDGECVPPDIPDALDGGVGDGAVLGDAERFEGGSGPADAGVPPPDGGLREGGADAGRMEASVEAGIPEPAEDCDPGREPNCIFVCEREEEEDCPDIHVKPLINRNQAEKDTVVNIQSGDDDLTEQMWVNYYTDNGSFESEVKLLNDSITGWNEDFGTEFHAPKEPGLIHIWAVAHDNRGGVGWVRATLRAVEP